MSARETAAVLLAAQAASGTRPARRVSSAPPPGAGVGSPPAAVAAAPLGVATERGEGSPLERLEPAGMQSEATDVRADLGYVHAPSPKAKAPTGEVEWVKPNGSRWEAQVRRVSGKRCWVYGPTEAAVRAAAATEARR